MGEGPAPRSLGDGSGGALVDAGAAVDALAGVDDSDVLDRDGSLGADVGACTACDALGIDGDCHLDYLYPSPMQEGI